MKYECDKQHIFEQPAKLISTDDNVTLETTVCPHCNTASFLEYRPAIISVMSVALDEVDAQLQNGYQVSALYAKTATLVKKE